MQEPVLQTLLLDLLIAGIIFIAIGVLINWYFYQRRSFVFTEKEFIPPRTMMLIAPDVKFALTFKVPRKIKSNESGEVIVEYFQGVTYWITESFNDFLYERLDIIPKPLPNELRGLVSFTGRRKVRPFIESDISARLTSKRIQVMPEGWRSFTRGTKVPCRWRWSISCFDPGKYTLMFEADAQLQELIPNGRLAEPIFFQVEVKDSKRPSLYLAAVMKTIFVILGSLLGSVSAFLIALLAAQPSLQTKFWEFLSPWFSQLP